MNDRCRRSGRVRRRGLTLWEVMLALAILGGSIAVIGQLVRLGVRAAGDARDLSTAQLLCEAKLAELASGMEPVQTVSAMPLMYDPEWVYSVEAQPVDQQGLLAVRVTVQKAVADSTVPVAFSLDRWIVDPALEFQQVELEAAEEAAQQAEAEASGASAGGSGSGEAP